MLTSLEFKAEFTSTGKVLRGNHEFEEGMTAIIGPNESGKSLRIELVRYALFGSKALRADSKSYKSLWVKLTFAVQGKAYVVEREGSKVSLITDGKPLATGTKPVNEAILRILGYNLEVFDVANAVLQGEIEALTQKTPSERKRMVDRTIGLDAVDEVIKMVNEDLSASRKAKAMLEEKVVQVFEPPVYPEGVDKTTSEELETQMDKLRESLQERKYLEGRLDTAVIDTPKPLGYNPVDEIKESLDELQGQAQLLAVEFGQMEVFKNQWKDYEFVSSALGDLTADQVRKYLKDDLPAKWEAYHNYKKLEVSEPTYTAETLEFVRQGNHLKAHETDSISVTCPACNHEFSVDPNGEGNSAFADFDWEKYEETRAVLSISSNSDISRLERELEAWEKFRDTPAVAKPDQSEIPHAENLDHALAVHERLMDAGFNPVVVEAKLNDSALKYKKATDRINALITQKKFQLAETERFDRQMEAYTKYLQLEKELAPKIAALKFVDEQLMTMQNNYLKVRAYEDAVKDFDSRQKSQESALETVRELEEAIDELSRVKKALTNLKPKVKMHLLPSLNRVASQLLSEMTNGQRSRVEVQEDFDIIIDGQPVNTLSGSGKAVANLAVRIGLGAVLTHRVFSVLMADEIDASMDDQRAAYTAQCLRNLSNNVKQIVLVSHQQPEADHYIDLGA